MRLGCAFKNLLGWHRKRNPFSLICALINGWVNNREAGDLRRHRARYDVTVMNTTRTKQRIFKLCWCRTVHEKSSLFQFVCFPSGFIWIPHFYVSSRNLHCVMYTEIMNKIYPHAKLTKCNKMLIVCMNTGVNSLRTSDAIWRNKSGSTSAQVMACCLTAPTHYLNQCWLQSRQVAFTRGQFHKRYINNQSLKLAWKLSSQNFINISQGPMSSWKIIGPRWVRPTAAIIPANDLLRKDHNDKPFV